MERGGGSIIICICFSYCEPECPVQTKGRVVTENWYKIQNYCKKKKKERSVVLNTKQCRRGYSPAPATFHPVCMRLNPSTLHASMADAGWDRLLFTDVMWMLVAFSYSVDCFCVDISFCVLSPGWVTAVSSACMITVTSQTWDNWPDADVLIYKTKLQAGTTYLLLLD